jgi:hypothetical protein
MKKIIVLIGFLFIVSKGHTQWVTCGSPFANFGLPVTFCGYVKGATHATIGKNSGTVLYLCGDYPNQDMTFVLKDADPPIFTDPPESYIDKRVCATGTVQTYRGKYYIVVKKKSQFDD